MKHTHHRSVFDYPILIQRMHRYVVVSSPDFGYRVASGCLPLDQLNAEAIGHAVLQVLSAVGAKLAQLEREGAPVPAPGPSRRGLAGDILTVGEAARAVGVSQATLRKMAALGALRAQRTPGGHLRFTLDAISEYLLGAPATGTHARKRAESAHGDTHDDANGAA